LPAHVVGDGQRTIAQLVEQENGNPLRGEGHDKPLTRIEIDDATIALLRRAGRSLDDVPAAGERSFLRQTANLSTGGTARDVTDLLHPSVARLCERAARIIGLDVCGLDLIAPDVEQPLPPSGAGIIEVNAAPGIRMHHHPSEGKPRDVGAAIIDMLYPPGTTGRIPIIAVTGTNGKTTVTRMIAHALQSAGKHVGMTTTDGISIDGHGVAEGDMTGLHSARAACRAQGLSREQVAAALASFDGNGNNGGRMNLFRVRQGYVIVDYGHNVGAFQAMGELTRAWPGRRITGVFTVPGDRTDELIEQAARLAARCFGRLIIREDEDLRGRCSGEVAKLICRAVRDEEPGKECRVVSNEGQRWRPPCAKWSRGRSSCSSSRNRWLRRWKSSAGSGRNLRTRSIRHRSCNRWVGG
jgi:hypothetical protein